MSVKQEKLLRKTVMSTGSFCIFGLETMKYNRKPVYQTVEWSLKDVGVHQLGESNKEALLNLNFRMRRFKDF